MQFAYVGQSLVALGFLVLLGCKDKGSTSVERAPHSVVVSPTGAALSVGQSQAFAASVRDVNGQPISGHDVAWSSTASAVVSVSGSGLATALAEGTGSVRATAGAVFGDAGITVVPPGTVTFGPGPNSPAWAGKVTYPSEVFATDVPVVGVSPAGASGFHGLQGFNGYNGTTWNPDRVAYPTVNTPIGTKRVLELIFPGERRVLAATNATSATYPLNQDAAIRISGTWVGQLVIERSTDGGTTWNQFQLSSGAGPTLTANGIHTTAASSGLLRVRASSMTSGAATVDIGMAGGASPARGFIGSFATGQTRFYTRFLVRLDPNWSNNENAGTKLFFFRGLDGQQNHHFNLTHFEDEAPYVRLQNVSVPRNIVGPTGSQPIGEWLDIEFLAIANTPGNSNGTLQIWVNGVQRVNVSDVRFYDTGSVHEFRYLFLDPTFGGGFQPPNRTQSVYIAAWYRESAP